MVCGLAISAASLGLLGAAADLGEDLLVVPGVAAGRARRVDAFLAVDELDDGAGGVAHGAVLGDLEVLQGVDEAALHVAGAAGADGRVDEALAATHGVEEVLRGRQAGLVGRGDEALGLGAEVAPLEVRQGALVVAAVDALAADGLLADEAGRSEEHTSELQSRLHLACRLL